MPHVNSVYDWSVMGHYIQLSKSDVQVACLKNKLDKNSNGLYLIIEIGTYKGPFLFVKTATEDDVSKLEFSISYTDHNVQ